MTPNREEKKMRKYLNSILKDYLKVSKYRSMKFKLNRGRFLLKWITSFKNKKQFKEYVK